MVDRRLEALPVPLLPAWLRWAGVVAVAAFVFYTSILTAPPETVLDTRPSLLPLDKWRHFLAYAALAGALAYATVDWEMRTRRVALAVVGASLLYGVGIELGQAAIPGRYFSLGDAWANAIGALLVTPLFALRSTLSFVPLHEWLRDVAPGR